MRSRTVAVVTVAIIYQMLDEDMRVQLQKLAEVMCYAAQRTDLVWAANDGVYTSCYQAIFAIVSHLFGEVIANRTMTELYWDSLDHVMPNMGLLRMSGPLFDLLTAIEKAHNS